MSHEPSAINQLFKFALSPDEPPLTPESDLWSAPLPASRHAFGSTQGADTLEASAMTYGDYFAAVRDFLSQDNFSLLCNAASDMKKGPVTLADLEHISVYLLKYGAYYHPSCIRLGLLDGQVSFVLNVAVSSEGRQTLPREYDALSRLDTDLTERFWPRCYGMGRGEALDGHPVPMFLGQWFEGFYEFHLSPDNLADENPGMQQVVVWDSDRGHRMLSGDQAEACLEQAACILTYAYKPLTFEAIGRWHHAAGDFVIAMNDGKIDLRMITVRKYSPIIENDQPDVALILEALLLFLVEISLRLRLDRIDGVGRMVCYGSDFVPAICHGFFRGLKMAAPVHGLPDDFDATVKEYVALHSVDQLMPMVSAIVEKTGFNAEEKGLLGKILDSHVSTLISATGA